ncbi:short-chain dehydrogenase/reductase SDR [Acidithiobacillus ferrivorans SS3]|uniref:Short-chain dehydrogenase/reductase SDR n=1 Tax=Acidithiobacillus ferrivorans SS3 TaxID=743299 RepID=G0JP34_9PROT|nr:SDR family NAD(P)-dependent oxidoreductase [Acidithiobacillus ferrivorans]AEM48449.1 short-chain dehydrogenase/reductase SDR [Acidithiobacillus ferrivorans SS3]
MQITYDFTGKVALVTGGSSGLGKSIATGLIKAGAKVIIIGRDSDKVMRTKNELASITNSELVMGLSVDVTNEREVSDLMDLIHDKYGRLDILINSAGVYRLAPAEHMSLSEWNDIISINLTGTFLCCKEAAKYMIQNGGGKIVNVSSISAFCGFPGEAAYSPAKAGVSALTKVLAVEWIRNGINVNCIGPCDFDTPMMDEVRGTVAHNEFLKTFPIGRMGQPDEIVGAALFLSSDASNMIVGHTLMVDGGYCSV